MRQTIAGLVAGAAFAVSMGVAPASACQVVDPCRGGLFQSGYSYGSYNYTAERLPDPQGPQYYYVNQGPLYSGPGNLAPAPTYQERAVTGWQGYSRPYYYGYNGGPYANATNHFYDGAPAVQGPAVYSYRPRRATYRPYRVGPSYYAARPRVSYGYRSHHVHAPRHAMHGPRVYYAPRHSVPQYRHAPRVLRYKN